jgi:hypothetical protein
MQFTPLRKVPTPKFEAELRNRIHPEALRAGKPNTLEYRRAVSEECAAYLTQLGAFGRKPPIVARIAESSGDASWFVVRFLKRGGHPKLLKAAGFDLSRIEEALRQVKTNEAHQEAQSVHSGLLTLFSPAERATLTRNLELEPSQR